MRNTIQKSIFPIGLGAMPLSIVKRPSYEESIKVIHCFLEAGGNFIDTANIYGLDDSDLGHNERLIAEALKEFKRDDILVATKGGGSRPNGGWALENGHPKQLRQACETSLRQLKIDVIELYYLHGPDPNVPFIESVSALHMLKQEGKIKHIGLANVSLQQIKQAREVTQIVAVQNRCNPFCKQDFYNGVIDYCAQNEIMYVPYCPLGGWYDHSQLAKDQLYTSLKQKYNVSSYTLNLAWLINQGKHIIPIPGMDATYQISENFSTLDLVIDQEDLTYMNSFPDRYLPTT